MPDAVVCKRDGWGGRLRIHRADEQGEESVFKRVLRLGFLALVGSVGLLANSTPAVAEPGAGAGAVAGQVTLATGLDLTCLAINFNFTSFALLGALTVGEHQYVGAVNTGAVSGNSSGASTTVCPANQDNSAVGRGVVNPFTVNGNSTLVNQLTVTITTTINGTCSGNYTRVGTTTVVVLTCTLTASRTGSVSGLSSTASGTIVVAAQFVPTDGDGVTDPVNTAAFAGAFAGAGL